MQFTNQTRLLLHEWTRGAPVGMLCSQGHQSLACPCSGALPAGLSHLLNLNLHCQHDQILEEPACPVLTDFFISVLNTRVWKLLLGTLVIYLITFFVFAGFWLLIS